MLQSPMPSKSSCGCVSIRKTHGGRFAKRLGPPSPAARLRGVKRIREVRLSPGQSAAGVLRRGEVSLIDHVPPDQVAGLAASPEIKVGRYAQPVVHVIATRRPEPGPAQPGIAPRTFVCRRPQGPARRSPPQTPGHRQGYGCRRALPQGKLCRRPWCQAARVASLAGEDAGRGGPQGAGGQPIRLNFEYPAIPEVRVMAQKLAESFRAAGIEIATAEVLPSRLEAELRSGRRFDLAYRVLRCDEPVFDAGMLLCPGYEAPADANALASSASPRILQLLLQLERAVEWPTARGLAIQIDRESRDELPVIPLWQLVDHYAWRDRLKGPAQSASDELYQGIETWEITPWIAKDPWKAP